MTSDIDGISEQHFIQVPLTRPKDPAGEITQELENKIAR